MCQLSVLLLACFSVNKFVLISGIFVGSCAPVCRNITCKNAFPNVIITINIIHIIKLYHLPMLKTRFAFVGWVRDCSLGERLLVG